MNGARPRAGWRFVFAHPAHAVALGFGSGLAPRAPGTVGTLAAWGAYLLLDRWFDPAAWAVAVPGALVVGWWACTISARDLASADPSAIVWDEVVAFWLVLWVLMPAPWFEQLAAFALFRFFDAAKPGPVGWADRRFKPLPGASLGWVQGFGILFDDLVAAVCTLAVVGLARLGWT